MTGRLSDAELLAIHRLQHPDYHFNQEQTRMALAELLAIRGLACPSCGSDHVGRFDDIGAHLWFERRIVPITDFFCRECNHTWNRT